MNLLCKSQTDTRKADEYAMSEDFYKVFTEDVEGLYLLSYMLMGDHEKAERCFVGGLEDSVNGNSVYKQWARSWARRQIIQCAIRTVAPGLQYADDELNVEAESEGNPALAAILHLAAFERFVFVMSTLEGLFRSGMLDSAGMFTRRGYHGPHPSLEAPFQIGRRPDPPFADTRFHS